MSLKKKTISGLKWTSLSSIFSAAISFLQLFILARILGPQVYGTMAILMVVIGFANLFVDLGISRIIIHKQDNITINQLHSMYWMNIFLAILVYVVVFFSSPLIAKFYSNIDNLSFYIRLISISFIINAVSMQYVVLFQREMEFKILEIVNMIKVSLNFITALLLALNDFGVLSLIYALLFSNLVYSFVIIYKGWNYHKIKFYFNLSEIKDSLNFGMFFSASKIIGRINSSLDIILIGKFFSQETLGIYNIAKKLVMQILRLFMPIIQKITYPLFGKLNSLDKIKLKNTYVKIISLISFIIVSLYGMLYLYIDYIIINILGDKWLESINIIKAFILYAILFAIGIPIGSLLTAVGKVKLGFYWNLYNLIVFFITLLFNILWFHNIVYIALNFSFVMIFNFFIGFIFITKKVIQVSFFELYKEFFIVLLISILEITLFKNYKIDNFFDFIFSIFIYTLVYLIFNWFFNKNIFLYLKGIIIK